MFCNYSCNAPPFDYHHNKNITIRMIRQSYFWFKILSICTWYSAMVHMRACENVNHQSSTFYSSHRILLFLYDTFDRSWFQLISATFNDRVGELQRLQKIKPTPRSNRSFSRASLATLREHRFSRSALFINLPPVNHTSGMGGNNLNTLVVSSKYISSLVNKSMSHDSRDYIKMFELHQPAFWNNYFKCL